MNKMVLTSPDSNLGQVSDIQADHHRVDPDLLTKLNESLLACLEFDLGENSETSENDGIDANWEGSYLQFQPYEMEVMFLKMMMMSLATWDDTDGKPIWDLLDANLSDLVNTLEAVRKHFVDVIYGEEPMYGKQTCDVFASFLEGKIQQFKPLIVDYCHVMLDSSRSSLQYKPLGSDKTDHFLQDVLQNLDVLVRYKADAISSVKTQFDSLKLRVKLSRDLFQLMAADEAINCEELKDLQVCLHSFANNAAPLAFLFWALPENEEISFKPKMNQLLSDMWEKICKPREPAGKALFLETLNAIKLQPSNDMILLGEVVAGFVDLLLDNPVAASKVDWRTRERLILVFTFMTNPPTSSGNDEQLALLCNQIALLVGNCTYLIFSPNVIMEELITKEMIALNDFAENLEEMMGKVKKLYVKIPDSLYFDFPRTNGLGFYDFLLQNLETMREKQNDEATYISYAKNFIIKIEEELVSLRPLVNGIFEMQKVQKELEDTWSQVINLAYRIEHVINSSSLPNHPVWYNIASLDDIIDQIDHVKAKLEQDVKRNLDRIRNSNMPFTKVVSGSLEYSNTPSERRRFSINSEEIVGLKDDVRTIIDELTGGYGSLGILSIIGMGGLGKTTLAKEIYNSNIVRYHFHKLGFVSVSQVLNKRNFLVDILHGISNARKEEIDCMTEDDLAQHLWRCLSGQKYLIVVDDIWDIKAWDSVKTSFPDDKNKSRVVFTTRELKVALDAKSSIHDLQLRSDDESLKLLNMKVFGKQDCPSRFAEFGKLIVKTCKGLPLAIIVVAGLLARNKTSSSWWEEIAVATSRFVGQECKDIIGYSYMHLPEHLKSCFLYMAIYREDELIQAKKLRQLWIGEGFVSKSTTKSLRIVAKEYLKDLVDSNLLTAVGRTTGGEIRTCRLHDVIGDFCRRQAEEDNFLWVPDVYVSPSNSSDSTLCNRYRISIQKSSHDVEPAVLENVHSLICRDERSLRESDVEKLKLVQVLHLEGGPIFKFSNHLVHLRYIWVTRWVENIPESFCNLWNLETFILQSSMSAQTLPETIWKMKKLRDLKISGGCYLSVYGYEHEGRHHFSSNIQSLSQLVLRDGKKAREVLQRLPNIQKLSCHLPQDIEDFKIDFLHKLESLRVWYGGTSSILFRFPSALKRLYLAGGKILTQHTLSAIGDLPYLEVLKLHCDSNQWDVEDGQFQKLKYLCMVIQDLEQWDVSFDSFSCLEQLELIQCENLEELPACFAELPTLQRIQVKWCNAELERSGIQVHKDQTDNGNQVQLEIRNGQYFYEEDGS